MVLLQVRLQWTHHLIGKIQMTWYLYTNMEQSMNISITNTLKMLSWKNLQTITDWNVAELSMKLKNGLSSLLTQKVSHKYLVACSQYGCGPKC